MTHRGPSHWERRDLRTTRGRHRRVTMSTVLMGVLGVMLVTAIPGLS